MSVSIDLHRVNPAESCALTPCRRTSALLACRRCISEDSRRLVPSWFCVRAIMITSSTVRLQQLICELGVLLDHRISDMGVERCAGDGRRLVLSATVVGLAAHRRLAIVLQIRAACGGCGDRSHLSVDGGFRLRDVSVDLRSRTAWLRTLVDLSDQQPSCSKYRGSARLLQSPLASSAFGFRDLARNGC